MKNALKLTLFDLKNNKKQIIGWSVAIFSVMFLYMILFPYVQDIATIKMESIPQELLQFIGMEDLIQMSNFVSYYDMILGIVLIAISIFATTFTSSVIANEEKNKTIEFTYSLSIKRGEIFISKIITSIIAVAIVLYCAVFSSIICGFINGGETFDLIKVINISKVNCAVPFIFLSVSGMISGVFSKISGAMVGSVYVLFAYVFGVLSTMLGDNFSWLVNLSPFEVFSSNNTICMVIYIAIAIVMFVLGINMYKKRDFDI